MNGFDVVAIIVVGLAAVVGAALGVVRMAIAVASLVLATTVSLAFAEPLSAHLVTWVSSPGLRFAVAFVALYAMVLVVVALLGTVIRGTLSVLGLRWLDRLAGVALAAGSVTSVLVLFSLGVEARASQEAWVRESQVLPILVTAGHEALVKLPASVRQRIERWVGPSAHRASDGSREPDVGARR